MILENIVQGGSIIYENIRNDVARRQEDISWSAVGRGRRNDATGYPWDRGGALRTRVDFLNLSHYSDAINE